MKENKLGSTIAKLRKGKGLTQQELGDIVGVGAKAVSKWECNITLPDITIISDIAKALDVKTSYLIDSINEDDNTNKHQINNNKKNKEEKNELTNIICKSLGLAMSIGVIVLNILNKIEARDSITLLGIGLLTISLSQFQKNR